VAPLVVTPVEKSMGSHMSAVSWICRGIRRLGGLGLLSLVATACEQKAPPAFERPPSPVTVAAAVARDTNLYLDEVGKCVAQEVVSVQPQISGRIVKIHFADGADVKTGDLLFTIDARPIQALVEQAEATVARDRAQARQAEANGARDQAAVQQAQAALIQARAQLGQAEATVVRDQAQLENARVQDRRYAELAREGYVAREQADQVRTAMETAAATVRANQAMVDNGRAAIGAAEAALAQARAAVLAGQAAVENARASIRADEAMVESVRLQLAYTEIRSPIDGRAGQRLVDLGNVVTANTGALLSIHRLDPIYAEFTVTENDLGAVQRSMQGGRLPVEVRLPDQPEVVIPGALTFLDNTVQEGTGTVKLRATVPNRERRLWPGRFINVRLVLGRVPGAVLVPARAPQTSATGQFVFVVKDDGTAELRPVTLGQRQGDLVMVATGVKAGERIVVDGQMGVAPGGKVRIEEVGGPGSPPGPATAGSKP
jgi:multidrug efflux system membrane fusion protein